MYKYLLSQSLVSVRFLLACLGILLMASCSNPLDLLTGGGVNTAANVQVGKTNNQTIGTTSNTDQKIVRPKARDIRQSSDKNKVQADEVQTVVVNEVPVWVILLLILGWLLPSPGEMGRGLYRLVTRKKDT